MTHHLRQRQSTAASEQFERGEPLVSDECLTLRNYDGEDARTVTVRFRDAADATVFERTCTLPPLGVVSVTMRLDRAVYRVEAEGVEGDADAAECLLGSGPDETAVVEVGNGLVSVAEGRL